jgi:WXG100 family type VII secretion target
MANLNVSYGEMRDAAARLTAGQDDIATKLTELKGFIDGLVSSGFVTDQASVTFGESYGKFSHGATELIGGLSSLGDYLRKASDALEDTDKQLAAALRG